MRLGIGFSTICILGSAFLGILYASHFEESTAKIAHEKLFSVENNYNKKEQSITASDFLKMIPKDIPEEFHSILLETAFYESQLTSGIKQKNGVALGLMQIEPATHLDLYQNYLVYRPKLLKRLQKLGSYTSHDIQYNNEYAIYIAYLIYRRANFPIKLLKEKHSRALVYKKFYNTHKGKGELLGYIYGRD